MKLLKCKVCLSEVDLVQNERSTFKKIKCVKCHGSEPENKDPEIIIRRKRIILD